MEQSRARSSKSLKLRTREHYFNRSEIDRIVRGLALKSKLPESFVQTLTVLLHSRLNEIVRANTPALGFQVLVNEAQIKSLDRVLRANERLSQALGEIRTNTPKCEAAELARDLSIPWQCIVASGALLDANLIIEAGSGTEILPPMKNVLPGTEVRH